MSVLEIKIFCHITLLSVSSVESKCELPISDIILQNVEFSWGDYSYNIVYGYCIKFQGCPEFVGSTEYILIVAVTAMQIHGRAAK